MSIINTSQLTFDSTRPLPPTPPLAPNAKPVVITNQIWQKRFQTDFQPLPVFLTLIIRSIIWMMTASHFKPATARREHKLSNIIRSEGISPCYHLDGSGMDHLHLFHFWSQNALPNPNPHPPPPPPLNEPLSRCYPSGKSFQGAHNTELTMWLWNWRV